MYIGNLFWNKEGLYYEAVVSRCIIRGNEIVAKFHGSDGGDLFSGDFNLKKMGDYYIGNGTFAYENDEDIAADISVYLEEDECAVSLDGYWIDGEGNDPYRMMCELTKSQDVNVLIFENLVNLMDFRVDDEPDINIEKSLDKIPDWVTSFVRDFVERRLKGDVQVGLLDILGTYNADKNLVTIYRIAVEMCAQSLQIDQKKLENIVMTHELAHAATHMGVDKTGNTWTSFSSAPTATKEYFAQWYSHTYLSKYVDRLYETLMFTLADIQPDVYRSYRNDIHLDLKVMNSRLLSERSKTTYLQVDVKLCRFCKIRTATEEVARWDTWLGKEWSIPVCSICAPNNQQDWLT